MTDLRPRIQTPTLLYPMLFYHCLIKASPLIINNCHPSSSPLLFLFLSPLPYLPNKTNSVLNYIPHRWHSLIHFSPTFPNTLLTIPVHHILYILPQVCASEFYRLFASLQQHILYQSLSCQSTPNWFIISIRLFQLNLIKSLLYQWSKHITLFLILLAFLKLFSKLLYLIPWYLYPY